MEEEKKKERWIVTYTKHMKQKRKVYHDGFLDLHIPTNKLMLYDKSEKLLECRMLKKDEVVTSAETLTFASYFVDVGLLQFPSNLDSSDARKKSNEFRHINLSRSPSQKIIREFKKSELQKYGTQESAPTTTKAGVTEWQVLYSTQVTQKAKKYHDGFLKLINCGTLQRQIMLYDESKTEINRRFLKKDEVIQSGESILFDAHIVNIGEAEGNHPGLIDSDARVSNCNVAGKSGMIHRVQHSFKTNKSFLKGKPQNFASSKLCADPSFSIPSVSARISSQNIFADKPLRNATQILSVLQKPVNPESTATQSIVKNIMNSVPLVKEPQNSDSTKNSIDLEVSPDIYSKGLDSVAKSSSGGNKSSKNTDAGSLGQAHLENSESSYTKSCNEASVPGSSSRTVHTFHERVDVMKDCGEVKNSREAVSCPSFELGFD